MGVRRGSEAKYAIVGLPPHKEIAQNPLAEMHPMPARMSTPMQGCLRQQAAIACSVEEIFRWLDRCNRLRSSMLLISAACLWGASLPETPSDALSAGSWRTTFEISRSYSR